MLLLIRPQIESDFWQIGRPSGPEERNRWPHRALSTHVSPLLAPEIGRFLREDLVIVTLIIITRPCKGCHKSASCEIWKLESLFKHGSKCNPLFQWTGERSRPFCFSNYKIIGVWNSAACKFYQVGLAYCRGAVSSEQSTGLAVCSHLISDHQK